MQRRGFTLLEISIVLAIIAVVMGSGLVLSTAYLQKRQLDATLATMDTIEDALLKYSVAYNRIPCPGDMTLTQSSPYFGMEAGAGSGSSIGVGTGTCTGTGMLPQANNVATSGATEGGVPTRALQLPDSYMFDGWGRKIRYAVDPTQTVSNALPSPVGGVSCPATSALTVYDATATNARTTSAAYALISHGANGHGGYTANGVIHNVGSTNSNELINCHCTSTGAAGTYTPTYIEQAASLDPSSTTDNFDDIVTFKEPWQLQTPNNPLAASVNSCFYLAVASGSATPYLTLYSFKNSTLTKQPISLAPNAVSEAVDFSPDDTLLAMAGYASYTYDEGILYNVSAIGMSSPYVYYDPSNTHSDHMNDVKFSPDGNYFVSGGHLPYIQINYKNSGAWTSTASLAVTPSLQQWNFAWSPDSSTLYAAENTGGAPNASHYIHVYSHTSLPTPVFTDITAEEINTQSYGAGSGSNGVAANIAVHPSGSYLAYGIYRAASTSGNYYHPIVLANIPNASGTHGTVTQLTSGLVNYGSTESSKSVAWSPDGNYLAVALTVNSNGFDVYKFSPTTSPIFTEGTVSGGGCGTGGNAVAFSKDGNYLAVGTSTSPYLCIYSRSSNSYTNLNVTPALSGNVNGLVWSK